MPELPEVERGRRIAERTLVDRRIVRATAADDRIIYTGVTPRKFAAAVRGRTVLAAHRKGKHLWFELDRPPHPVLHFGMTGSFVVADAGAGRPRFWKLELVTDRGTKFYMLNKRRLGRIRLQLDPSNEPPISRLGFDPLLDMPGPAAVAALLAKRKAPIKAVLLDQSVLAGVGNWIADEVLYQAKIDPNRKACDLAAEEAKQLRAKLGLIIRKAVVVDAEKERFPRSWLFHRRWGKEKGAVTVKGEPIIHETIGGRTTAWVPTVQV